MKDNQYTGWTPVLGTEEYKDGFIIKVTNWLGDGCNKPSLDLYVAEDGFTNKKDLAKVLPIYKGEPGKDGNGTPDEEDITLIKKNNVEVLQFKNKAYIPEIFSGLGTNVLRKNNFIQGYIYNKVISINSLPTTNGTLTLTLNGSSETINLTIGVKRSVKFTFKSVPTRVGSVTFNTPNEGPNIILGLSPSLITIEQVIDYILANIVSTEYNYSKFSTDTILISDKKARYSTSYTFSSTAGVLVDIISDGILGSSPDTKESIYNKLINLSPLNNYNKEIKNDKLYINNKELQSSNFNISLLSTTDIVTEITETINNKKINPLLSTDLIPNSILEIRYDFDLNGKQINLPENVTLDFKGGSFSNGILKGNNTKIIGNTVKIFSNIKFNGDFNIDNIYVEWFGADSIFINSNNNDIEALSSPIYKPTPEIINLKDSSLAFKEALDLSVRSGGTVKILSRFYAIDTTVKIPMKSIISFNSDTVIFPRMVGKGKRVMEQSYDSGYIKELPIRENPIETLAPNRFVHTDDMAVAFEIFPQQTKIIGRGTISLVLSKFTIGLLIKGTGFHFLDMSYGTPDIDIRTVGDKPNIEAPDERDLLGDGIPSTSLGSLGQHYWDRLNKSYYRKGATSWSLIGSLGSADPKFNVGLRIDVGSGYNSGRLINPQIKLWHMFGWRGIEFYTHDGGWFNESLWDGCVSNCHGSFISIYTNFDIVNHDMSKLKLQTDVRLQYDARIFQCIRGEGITLGFVWDLSWVQPRIKYGFYLGKFTKSIKLLSIDRLKYVKDEGINNSYEFQYNDDNKDPITATSYKNLLKFRTPYRLFGLATEPSGTSHQLGWWQGNTLDSDPISLYNTCMVTNVNNSIGYPRLLFDEDSKTMIDVINTDNNLFYTCISLARRGSTANSPFVNVRTKGSIVIEYVFNNFNSVNSTYPENDFPFYLMSGEAGGQTWYNAETNNGARPFYNLYKVPSSFMSHNGFAFGNPIQRMYIPVDSNSQALPYLIFYAKESKIGASMQLINIKFFSDGGNNSIDTIFNVTSGTTLYRPDAAPKGHVYEDTTINRTIINKGTSSIPDWREFDGAKAGVLRSGSTAQRPLPIDIYIGFIYFDTNVGKSITWNGTSWVIPS